MGDMLHLEQLKDSVEALSQKVVKSHQQRTLELETALRWLEEVPDSNTLREQVKAAPDLAESAAIPATDVPLNQRITQTNAVPKETAVVAVDGSQIAPDRHAAVLYYLIQVGGLLFRYNSEAPLPFAKANLYHEDTDLFDQEGLVITWQLGLRRTVAEIVYLAELTKIAHKVAHPSPIIALTDGPLLWTYRNQRDEEKQAFATYMEALTTMQKEGGMPAGFTERPGGNPLISLLALSKKLGPSKTAEQERELRTLTDHDLMARFLKPGQRSAWLQRSSEMNTQHAHHGHRIWFCYINVGEPGYPVIARLETPEWAAQQTTWCETLHAVLVQQAEVLHGNPYVLARAHELALVTNKDKAALDIALQQRLFEQGIESHTSEKARQKSYLSWQR